jgi:GNAT superfamily N-acetyltransferase
MVNLRRAIENDIPSILVLMKDFYQIDGYPFKQGLIEPNLHKLIFNESLGRLWLVEFSNQTVGYLALTFGFSFEYGGRDAFIDEFFIVEDYRGKGIGKTVLQLLEPLALEAGVQTLHLEVEPHNKMGNQLYLKSGFKGNDRILLNKAINK